MTSEMNEMMYLNTRSYSWKEFNTVHFCHSHFEQVAQLNNKMQKANMHTSLQLTASQLTEAGYLSAGYLAEHECAT